MSPGSAPWREAGEDEAEDPNSTFDRFLCNSQSQRFLESCSLTKRNITSVNQWLAQTKLFKNKKQALDLAVAEFVATAGKLDAGSKRPVNAIAVEWGLNVKLAAKLNETCLIRLIAGLICWQKSDCQRTMPPTCAGSGPFSQKFMAWFALVLPLLYRCLSHSMLDRLMWVRANVLRRVMQFSGRICFD